MGKKKRKKGKKEKRSDVSGWVGSKAKQAERSSMSQETQQQSLCVRHLQAQEGARHRKDSSQIVQLAGLVLYLFRRRTVCA